MYKIVISLTLLLAYGLGQFAQGTGVSFIRWHLGVIAFAGMAVLMVRTLDHILLRKN